MSISKRSPDCNECDCCEIYSTTFCEILGIPEVFLGYLGEEWDDETPTGNSWSVRNTTSDCFVINCPSDEGKVWAEGVFNDNFPGRRALFKQQLPDKYSAFFDLELTYDPDITSSTYNVGIELVADYVDDDNWHGVRIHIDGEHSTGTAVVFELMKMNSGSLELDEIDYITLPSAVFTWRERIEFAVDTCDAGDPFIFLSTSEFSLPLLIDAHGGNQLAMAVMGSTTAGSETFDCDGVTKSISKHVRVYDIDIKRNADDLAGCEEINLICCKCGIPLELEVNFSGWADSDCDVCDDDLNGTYSLGYIGQVSIDDELCCKWSYSWPAYSAPSCTVPSVISGAPYEDTMTLKKLDLTLCPGGVWQVNLHVIAGFSGGLIGGTCTYSWNYDEEIDSLSECSFEGTETFTYDSGLGCLAGSPGGTDIYAQFSHWCNTTGTVTVSNG
mgnify:CR=1 FL=1